MAKTYYDDDADLRPVQDRQVAVLGYGSQGHAHALSLRDCGVDVRVGLPEGSASRGAAEAEGLRVLTPYAACEEADLIVVLAPDQVQASLYDDAIAPNLVEGDALLFGHGFNPRFGHIEAPAGVDVCLVAPQGLGSAVRREFSEGRGVPVLLAVDRDASGRAWELALSYAKGIGGLRAGGIATTFAEEAEARLFGAQAVSRGGVAQLVIAGFETLTEAGYQPEVAYFECLQELELVVDLMYAGGIASGRRSGSDTAEYGGYVCGPRIVDASVKARMRDVLEDIRTGSFAQRFGADQGAGAPELGRLRAEAAQHPIEATGRELRRLVSPVRSHRSDHAEGSA